MKENVVIQSPGAFISGLMDERKMTVKELAKQADIPAVVLRDVLSGKSVVTVTVAEKLEKVFRVPAKTFINREILWRKHLLQQRKNR